MISKQKRLTTSRVQYVLKKGARFGSSKFFSIRFVPTIRSESRFCVIVSLKVAPGAVERNRLRRQLYEITRLMPAGQKNFDTIIIAKPATKGAAFEPLQKELERILKNLA